MKTDVQGRSLKTPCRKLSGATQTALGEEKGWRTAVTSQQLLT